MRVWLYSLSLGVEMCDFPLMCNMICQPDATPEHLVSKNHLKRLKLLNNVGLELKAGTFCGLVFVFISSYSFPVWLHNITSMGHNEKASHEYRIFSLLNESC